MSRRNSGEGRTTGPIARNSREPDRIIVTHHDDFALGLDDDCRAAFYFADATLSAKQVADVAHRVWQVYAQEEVEGLECVGTEWRWSEPRDAVAQVRRRSWNVR